MRTFLAAIIFCLVSTTALALDPAFIWAGGSLKLSNESNPCYVADSFFSLGMLDSQYLFSEPMPTLKSGKLGFDLGVGSRVPIMNGHVLVGYNLFFDYSGNHGHKRLGAGLEMFFSNFSGHMNLYLPISGERHEEVALSGIDLTMGIPIPQASFVSVWPGFYFYSGRDEDDMAGMSLAIRVKPLKPLTISVGGRSDTLQSGKDKNEVFAKAECVIPIQSIGKMKDLFVFDAGQYPMDVRSQMDSKVVREEFITYENKHK
jgi:hypothetical protein